MIQVWKNVHDSYQLVLAQKARDMLLVQEKEVEQFQKNIVKRQEEVYKTLEKALTDSGISYILYDKTVANPTTMNVAEALELYHENNCQAIIENMTGKLDHSISLFLFCRKSEGD